MQAPNYRKPNSSVSNSLKTELILVYKVKGFSPANVNASDDTLFPKHYTWGHETVFSPHDVPGLAIWVI